MRDKFTWVVVAVLMVANTIIAQDKPREVNATVVLEPMLQLNIAPDVQVEFGLMEVNEDLYHVTKEPEDVMFSVESTTNWNLSISSEHPYFSGTKHPEH